MSWKPVKGFQGRYEVSDMGEVRSLLHADPRPMRVYYDNHCLRLLLLAQDKKPKATVLRRIVAEAFVPNPRHLHYVKHKDNNPMNCAASNLEWTSSKKEKNNA